MTLAPSALSVRSERIAFGDGIRPGTINVRDGRIVSLGSHADRPAGVRELDAGDLVVLPGLVDTHVHINDPGRSDWEGFETATRAAAAGGITTLVDMPLNSIPPTTTVEGLGAKRRAAVGRCMVDVAFWGGVVPGNREALEPLAHAGVRGFKCFLSPSGVDEFAHVGEADLREAMPTIARLGLPLLAHAEWPALLRDPLADPAATPREDKTWLESRPPTSEQAAIDLLIQLAREFNARVHVVHLATPEALPAAAAARRSGVHLSVETCPHYMTFAAEDIPEGATAFKCAPPIRERRSREGLWAGLMEGDIDFVATDHSPAPPELKRLADGDFVRAWGGIASLQIALSAVWTGMCARRLPMELVTKWLAAAPASLAGLSERKGSLAVGADADLVIWDPEAELTVDGATLYHRHPVTPYHGARLRGRVRTTILRGNIVYHEGELQGPPGGPTAVIEKERMAAITTHVLDTSRGRPAAGVPVALEREAAHEQWELIGRGETDTDGRLRTLTSSGPPLTPGVYRLVFDVDRYFKAQGTAAFSPLVIVVFRTVPGEQHYHVPLLLSPFGYTTYKGS